MYYLLYLVLLLKITLFNTVHCDGKNLTRLWWRLKMLRVEKVVAHTAFWENLWTKASPNRASIDSSEKRIMLDYQLTVLLVKVVCTTFCENSEPVWNVHVRIHVAPLACYPFINIKLAAYHLLLYVVYLCQKSQNFVYALICYRQKCKVVSLNLAHPVRCCVLCWNL